MTWMIWSVSKMIWTTDDDRSMTSDVPTPGGRGSAERNGDSNNGKQRRTATAQGTHTIHGTLDMSGLISGRSCVVLSGSSLLPY